MLTLSKLANPSASRALRRGGEEGAKGSAKGSFAGREEEEEEEEKSPEVCGMKFPRRWKESEDSVLLIDDFLPGGGGGGLVGVPVFGGRAGGTSELAGWLSSWKRFLLSTPNWSAPFDFAKALKSAKPPPNDSLPNTAANGSASEEALTVVPPGAKGSLDAAVSFTARSELGGELLKGSLSPS